jgi:plastocyanin
MKNLLVLSVIFSFNLYGQVFHRFNTPLREHSIIATKDGYFPDHISIFEGEKLRIFFTSTSEVSSCLKIREKKLFLSAKKGGLAEGEVTFNSAGVFEYYCPAENLKGTITVLRKTGSTSSFRGQGRTIQSVREKKQNQWRPREE